jgi:6-pyruvoyltetrahydropterin/6-carboxytetrahydropterin synthase
MTRITRRLEIDAGHRLQRHTGKCRNYHGHRYVFLISCYGEVGPDGMVIDFSIVKNAVGEWLDVVWDHGMILERGDPMIPLLEQMEMKHAVLDVAPTAENLAAIVYRVARELLNGQGITVSAVECFETPNCSAEFI